MSSKLFEVGETVLKSVAKSFDRTETSLNQDVKKVKEWMRTQPHLPEIMDDKTIQNFLILNKCSIEKTKPKLDMYYTIRSQLSNIFENINPKLPNLKKTMEIIYYVPLPKLTKEMYRVFAFKVRDKTMIDELDISDVIRLLINLAEVRMKEDVAFGDVVIIDAKDFSLKFLMQLTPTVLYKLLVTLYEKVLSARLKAVYIINTYPFMTKFLAIVKAVMKPKLFERLHMCQDPNILQEKFDIAMLPGDFGGNEKSLEELQKLLALKFLEYQNRFDRLDTLRVDETLRPKKLQNHEILGYHGNFRRLDVD